MRMWQIKNSRNMHNWPVPNFLEGLKDLPCLSHVLWDLSIEDNLHTQFFVVFIFSVISFVCNVSNAFVYKNVFVVILFCQPLIFVSLLVQNFCDTIVHVLILWQLTQCTCCTSNTKCFYCNWHEYRYNIIAELEHISMRQLIWVHISANAYVCMYVVSRFRNIISHSIHWSNFYECHLSQ